MGMPTLSLNRDTGTGAGVGHAKSQHIQAHDNLPKMCPLGLGDGSGFTPRRGGSGQLGRAVQGLAQG